MYTIEIITESAKRLHILKLGYLGVTPLSVERECISLTWLIEQTTVMQVSTTTQ